MCRRHDSHQHILSCMRFVCLLLSSLTINFLLRVHAYLSACQPLTRTRPLAAFEYFARCKFDFIEVALARPLLDPTLDSSFSLQVLGYPDGTDISPYHQAYLPTNFVPPRPQSLLQ